jgi:hypothetical protein
MLSGDCEHLSKLDLSLSCLSHKGMPAFPQFETVAFMVMRIVVVEFPIHGQPSVYIYLNVNRIDYVILIAHIENAIALVIQRQDLIAY